MTETLRFISSGNYTELQGDQSAFPHVSVSTYGNEWLVVKNSGVTRNRIIVGAGKTLNIIMCDGSSLTSQITVEAGQTVNIFGQLQDSGFLTGDSDDMFDTGIGAYYEADAGTINIHGGNIMAVGSTSGIGGVEEHHGGTINIYGGTIDAYGSKNSAAIGGAEDSTGGTIRITGGYVRAYGGNNAAGIGSGEETTAGPNINGGTITITGGDVSGIGQDGGAGIGAGAGASAGVISIEGGTVEGHGGKDCIGAIRSNDTEHEPNTITIGDYMRVNAGSEYFAEADRIYWFWNARDIHIEPCSHSGNPCTWCKYGK